MLTLIYCCLLSHAYRFKKPLLSSERMLFARSSLNQGLAPVRPHTNSAEHNKSIVGELYKLARELEKMEEK